MSRQVMQQRMMDRSAAPAQAALIAGPHQARLSMLAASLNKAAPVQRVARMLPRRPDSRPDCRPNVGGGGTIQARPITLTAGSYADPASGGVAQLALGDYWNQARRGLGGLSVGIGAAAGAVGYGVAAAATLANPVVWGLGLGLGATALASYALGGQPAAGAPPAAAPAPIGGAAPLVAPPLAPGPAPRRAPGNTILDMRFRNDSDSDDPDWTPEGVFHGRRQDILDGREPRTALETVAHTTDGTYARHNVGPGMVSSRSGRADQLFVQSREGDYGDEKVAVDYDVNAEILDEAGDVEREERGHALLRAALGEPVNFAAWPDRVRRAGAHLIGFTQLAEEHATRTPGSALLARGALQAVADGTHTFVEAFGRAGGAYTPAHVGGTQEMREVADGTRAPDPSLAGLAGDL